MVINPIPAKAAKKIGAIKNLFLLLNVLILNNF
jgi:hypothetical protein